MKQTSTLLSLLILLSSMFAAVVLSQERRDAAGEPVKRSTAVRVEICEQGLNDKDAWPDSLPTATESFEIKAFGLDQIPPKYVDDGIRGTRPSPSMVRFSAVVELPAGKHRFLIRARSAARLSLNGVLIVENSVPA